MEYQIRYSDSISPDYSELSNYIDDNDPVDIDYIEVKIDKTQFEHNLKQRISFFKYVLCELSYIDIVGMIDQNVLQNLEYWYEHIRNSSLDIMPDEAQIEYDAVLKHIILDTHAYGILRNDKERKFKIRLKLSRLNKTSIPALFASNEEIASLFVDHNSILDSIEFQIPLTIRIPSFTEDFIDNKNKQSALLYSNINIDCFDSMLVNSDEFEFDLTSNRLLHDGVEFDRDLRKCIVDGKFDIQFFEIDEDYRLFKHISRNSMQYLLLTCLDFYGRISTISFNNRHVHIYEASNQYEITRTNSCEYFCYAIDDISIVKQLHTTQFIGKDGKTYSIDYSTSKNFSCIGDIEYSLIDANDYVRINYDDGNFNVQFIKQPLKKQIDTIIEYYSHISATNILQKTFVKNKTLSSEIVDSISSLYNYINN